MKLSVIIAFSAIVAFIIAADDNDAEGARYNGYDNSPDDSFSLAETEYGLMEVPPNRHPLLLLVSRYESNNQYNVMFGGKKFFDYSDHPLANVPKSQWPVITKGVNKGLKSSAAGKYQFLLSTWKRLQKKLGLTDFGPENQEIAAFELLRESGAYSAYLDGNMQLAVSRAARIWTSLPNSGTGESQLSMNEAVNFLYRLA